MIKSLLVATALVAACSAAAADQDYKLWFDNANAPLGLQVGDITRGLSLYHAPAWARGRRIANPDHYALRRAYGSVLQDAQGNDQSGNLNTDVHLWMNRCGRFVADAPQVRQTPRACRSIEWPAA